MPEDDYSLYKAVNYSDAPDEAIMRAEEDAEWAIVLAAEEMREGKIEERTLFTWLDRNKNRFGHDAWDRCRKSCAGFENIPRQLPCWRPCLPSPA